MLLAQCLLLASSLAVGAEITLQPSRGDRGHSAYHRSIAGLDRPTDRTLETLKRYDLERRYHRDVDNALASLERFAEDRPDPDLVYALAELSWLEGRRLDRWRRSGALDRYLDAVAFAYDFLNDPELIRADPQRGSDPRYRTAMELYNDGVERLIRIAQAKPNAPLQPGGTIRLKVRGGERRLPINLRDSPWSGDDVDRLILASDYEVQGLPTHAFRFGLGVPLIGVRLADEPASESSRFYPPEMAFPLTAVLRPSPRPRRPGAGDSGPREFALELIDPVRVRTAGSPADIPVESDFTTPLAFMWSRTDLNRYRWTGFLRPGEALERANLMLLRPYEPGKIPVVMVHGLFSTPLAWIPMINDLLHEPSIQSRYQFLLYMYPTGVPVPIAAAGLRDSLRQAERMYNPGGRDPAFNRMVLLGHSMGGLLSHAMVVESDERFWQLNSDSRFRDIIGPRPVLDELQRYMFFHPLPFVRRVVFLATPHRGSELSRGVVGRVSSSLIAEPDHISDLLAQLIKDNPDAFDRRRFRRLPTSIETLEPISTNAPSVLKALLLMRPNPDVAFHSIIGSLRPSGVDQTTDGVVPYASAHLDGVASELLVRSDHGVQRDPKAILEVQRILLEHLGAPADAPRAALANPAGLK